jgi:hypothetical protein
MKHPHPTSHHSSRKDSEKTVAPVQDTQEKAEGTEAIADAGSSFAQRSPLSQDDPHHVSAQKPREPASNEGSVPALIARIALFVAIAPILLGVVAMTTLASYLSRSRAGAPKTN